MSSDNTREIAAQEIVGADERPIALNEYGRPERMYAQGASIHGGSASTAAIAKKFIESSEAAKSYGIDGPLEAHMANSPEFNTFDFARKVNAGMEEPMFKDGAHSDDVIGQIAASIIAAKQGRKR